MPVQVLFQRLHPDARLPQRTHASDAAYDVYLVEDITVPPMGAVRVRLGFAAALPEGYFARLTSRSSTQFFVRDGLIDAGYRGEWLAAVQNLSGEPLALHAGDRIGQMVLHQVIEIDWQEVDALPSSDRGARGFGSSGR